MGVSIIAAGSLVAALAGNSGLLLAGRVVQGMGGGTLPLGFGVVRDVFPDEKVAAAVGSLASLTAVGGGLGSVLAGPIVAGLGTAWLFWLPMIVTAMAAVGACIFILVSPARHREPIGVRPALPMHHLMIMVISAASGLPRQRSGWRLSRP